jgi:general secretion pathway protein G
MRRGRRAIGDRGFTLIELLVVMAILGILVAIAVPQLQKAPIRAKEASLREDLFTFRTCLDQFYADKGHYPDTLQALVTEKYIRKIPIDPFTKSADTWVVVMEEPDSSDTASQDPPGIIDVKSGSKLPSLDGSIYNTW